MFVLVQIHFCNSFQSVLSSLCLLALWATWLLSQLMLHWWCWDQKARAANAQSFTLWQQATIEITWRDHPIIACSWHIHKWVLFFAHIPFMVNRTFNECQQRRCNNIPSFYNKQHRSHVLFAKSAPGMTLNIQVTAPFCCDWKAQVANAQSFTLWQQATIQITQWDRSIIACSCHMLCIWV